VDGEGDFLCEAISFAAHSAEMSAIDECGKAYPTVPLVTPMSVQGPRDDVVEVLSGIISRTGRLGVSAGPFGNVSKPPTTVIFVGVKSPFMIGQARPIRPPRKKEIKKQVGNP
jgi:hypothetical protein